MASDFLKYLNRYPKNDGPRGNPAQWRSAFNARMNIKEAESILNGADPHVILGVLVGATMDEIKKAFRALAKQHHPDTGGSLKEFLRVHAAYVKLGGKS